MMAQARVFMSHATPDAAFATRLANDLRNLGVDVWLDSTHMGPGNFVTRINQALQRDVLILVLSPDAIASPWVQQEVSAAIARTNQGLMRPPIVVMARSVALQDIPPLWTVYHRYDAVQNYTVAVAHITREIENEKAQYSPPETPSPGIYGAQAHPQQNNNALASLILSIIGLVLSWIPLLGIIALILGISGVIIGHRALNVAKTIPAPFPTRKGMAITGQVIGYLAIALAALAILLTALLVYTGKFLA